MSDHNPAHLDRSTRERLHRMVSEYREQFGTKYRPEVRCVFRDARGQEVAKANGASTKGWGGSKHNYRPAYAVDLILVDDVAGTDLGGTNHREWMEYENLGRIWERLGGIWGGRWKNPCDPGHFEAPCSIAEIRAAQESGAELVVRWAP